MCPSLAAALLLAVADRGAPPPAPPKSSPAGATRPAAPKPSPKRNAPLDLWFAVLIDGSRAGYLHAESRPTPTGAVASMEFALTMPGMSAYRTRKEREYNRDAVLLRSSSVEEIDGDKVVGRERMTRRGGRVYLETEKPGAPLERLSLSVAEWEKREKSDIRLLPGLTLEAIRRRARTGAYEIITVGDRSVEAFRTESKFSDGGAFRLWADRNGEMVRFDIGDPAAGVSLRVERTAKALALAPIKDQSGRGGSLATDRTIEDPRSLRAARFYVTGLPAPPRVADNDVQTAVVTRQPDGKYAALVSVATGPAADLPPLRLSDIPRVRYAAFLQSGRLTPAETAEMGRLARRIVGSETDARRAAEKLDRWVYDNLSYDWDYSGQRSAAETLKTRKGVCQNYATLLVTLARAVGIPAKHCVGPVYSDGKYVAHAWAELWVGKWVAFEPTWAQPFADAARVKLSEGEPDGDAWEGPTAPAVRFLAAGEEPTPPAVTVKAPPFGDLSRGPDRTGTLEQGRLLAEKITQSAQVARQGETPPLLVTQDSLTAIAAIRYLPPGSYAEPRLAPSGFSLQGTRTVRGAEYVLPDGRRCLWISPRQPYPAYPEASAYGVRYRAAGEAEWSRAFFPALDDFTDPAKLAARIKTAATAGDAPPAAVLTARHAPLATLLKELGDGATASPPAPDPDHTDALGEPLPAITVTLPDGRRCRLIDAAGNIPPPVAPGAEPIPRPDAVK